MIILLLLLSPQRRHLSHTRGTIVCSWWWGMAHVWAVVMPSWSFKVMMVMMEMGLDGVWLYIASSSFWGHIVLYGDVNFFWWWGRIWEKFGGWAAGQNFLLTMMQILQNCFPSNCFFFWWWKFWMIMLLVGFTKVCKLLRDINPHCVEYKIPNRCGVWWANRREKQKIVKHLKFDKKAKRQV